MREKFIDALKGFAIILVVVGHVIQTSFLDYDTHIIYIYIYSFHMPLFIFLSGYVTYRDDFNSKGFLKKKATQLIIPYFSWMIISAGVLSVFRKVNFIDTILYKIIFPDNGLWFLWVLFIMHCGYSLYRKRPLVLFFVFFAWIIIDILTRNTPNYFLYKSIPYYLIYYMFAVLSKKYSYLLFRNKNVQIFSLPISILLILFVFYSLQTHSVINTLPSYFNSIYKVFIAIIGIMTWFLIIKSLTKFPEIILKIGKYTLSIYILQSFLMMVFSNWLVYLSFTKYFYLLLPIITFVVIILCILIFKLLTNNKRLSFYLFGK